MNTTRAIILGSIIIGVSYVSIELFKDYNSPLNKCMRETSFSTKQCVAITSGVDPRPRYQR